MGYPLFSFEDRGGSNDTFYFNHSVHNVGMLGAAVGYPRFSSEDLGGSNNNSTFNMQGLPLSRFQPYGPGVAVEGAWDDQLPGLMSSSSDESSGCEKQRAGRTPTTRRRTTRVRRRTQVALTPARVLEEPAGAPHELFAPGLSHIASECDGPLAVGVDVCPAVSDSIGNADAPSVRAPVYDQSRACGLQGQRSSDGSVSWTGAEVSQCIADLEREIATGTSAHPQTATAEVA